MAAAINISTINAKMNKLIFMARGFSLVGVPAARRERDLLNAANQWKGVAHGKRRKGLLVSSGHHGGSGRAIAVIGSPL